MLFRNKLNNFINRCYETAHGLILSDGLWLPKHHNVLLILGKPEGKVLHAAHNIITDAGDIYYAQKACGETPTNAFGYLKLSTANWGSTPGKTTNSGDVASQISGSSKAPTATYPLTNDADSDNTGAGTDIVTWAYSYTKADFNDADIDAGAITTSGASLGTGTSALLTAFDLTTFAKTANDTLKVFVNHTMNGV